MIRITQLKVRIQEPGAALSDGGLECASGGRIGPEQSGAGAGFSGRIAPEQSGAGAGLSGRIAPEQSGADLTRAIRNLLHLKEGEAFSYEVLRRSIDARKKPELYWVYTVQVQLQHPGAEKRILRGRYKNVEAYEPVRYRHSAPAPCSGKDSADSENRPVIVGTGPAGLFCGLLLARNGRNPILIERGQRARERGKSVQRFWEGGCLDPESNVQFGEGGAGTFSDGKLNTGIKDPEGRIRFILETFTEAGADPEILYSARPHVGTDVLRKVVTHLTDEICARGGEVFFETRLEGISRDSRGVWQASCRKRDGSSLAFSTRHLILAIGHSARDTFSMLKRAGILMTPKAFAVGVRIQHPQSVIDAAAYGEACAWKLPASSYRLTHRLPGNRGVYSFCMCPGGYVVNASSEEGGLAVNGMSYHDRSSGTANSAIVVTVSPEEITEYMRELSRNQSTDCRKDLSWNQLSGDMRGISGNPSEDVLSGVEFQRLLERNAYAAARGAIPVQRFGDFQRSGGFSRGNGAAIVQKSEDFTCAGRSGTRRLPDFEPGILGRWQMADVRSIFPGRICADIEEGIRAWERQIESFSSEDALLSAAETRTSSPVRIERGPGLQALSKEGLYPCGEGAGYAGGITSAAADGLKVAECILATGSRPRQA